MRFNLDRSEAPESTRYDVCIVGAGAAGITLARKLAAAGKLVALCEGGHLEFTGESQDLYQGEIFGDPYFDLDACRLRFFGGSTNHWGGMCRPLDEVDFHRDHLGPEYVWPITYDDIDPYLSEACDILEIDDKFDDEFVGDSHDVQRIDVKFSPPVYFGEKYLEEIEKSKNIHLYHGANFVDLDGEATVATSAIFKNFEGKPFAIQANDFVLAMGGIEIPRTLLWLQALHGGRFFDPNLPIGRYWMEHPHNNIGQALVGVSVEDGEYYALSGEKQRELGILNARFELDRQGRGNTKRLINEVLCVAPALGERLLTLFEKDLVCGVRLQSAWEQAPDVDNRVALSQSKDPFGIPRSELHWKKREIDRRTLTSSYTVFNEWLLDENLGRLRLDEWLLDEQDYPIHDDYGGNHHVGATRMGTRRDISVVDANCRIHGSENIYVAGSSVFTTGGHANPTLPIVQFTLRLADHLIA